MEIIIILVILLAAQYTLNILIQKNGTNKTKYPPAEKLPYIKSNLLTKTELTFYRYLQAVAPACKINVCPKVRLEDIARVSPNLKHKKAIQKYRGYIKARHVDFILCDQDMKPICAIELDDPSHNTKKAAEIDKFKDNVFKRINVKLFRVKTGTDYKEKVTEIFQYAQPEALKVAGAAPNTATKSAASTAAKPASRPATQTGTPRTGYNRTYTRPTTQPRQNQNQK